MTARLREAHRLFEQGHYAVALERYSELMASHEIWRKVLAVNYRICLDKLQRGEAARCLTRTAREPLLKSPQKLAIAVHVYYPELWWEIASRLKKITCAFDLYITTPPDQAIPVMSAIRSDFPRAQIQVKPDRGMDILPFLEQIPALIEEKYLAVCKLHTKKGHGDYGFLWRQVMLDSLIGDSTTFAACAAAFARHPELQLIGPASLYLSARQHMLGNAPILEALFQHLQNRPLPNRDWGFFSGTMFWIRPELLPRLACYSLQNIGKFETTYQKDGQLAHAIERLLGLLPIIHRGQVGLLHPNHPSHSPAYTLQMTSPITHISQARLDSLMHQYANLAEDHARLEQVNCFDSDHYRQQSPFLTGSAIDLITHYLVIGQFEGKTIARPCSA